MVLAKIEFCKYTHLHSYTLKICYRIEKKKRCSLARKKTKLAKNLFYVEHERQI